jgi:hypothetical protein
MEHINEYEIKTSLDVSELKNFIDNNNDLQKTSLFRSCNYNDYNLLEKFIYKISCEHLDKYKLNINDVYIEFWVKNENKIHNLHVDCDENKKKQGIYEYPFLASVLYLNDSTTPTIITDILNDDNNDNNIKKNDERSLYFNYPKTYNQITFNPQYYHGCFKTNSINDKRYIIAINFWIMKPSNVDFYQPNIKTMYDDNNNNSNSINDFTISLQSNTNIQLIYTDFLTDYFYDNIQNNDFSKLIEFINSNTLINNNILLGKNSFMYTNININNDICFDNLHYQSVNLLDHIRTFSTDNINYDNINNNKTKLYLQTNIHYNDTLLSTFNYIMKQYDFKYAKITYEYKELGFINDIILNTKKNNIIHGILYLNNNEELNMSSFFSLNKQVYDTLNNDKNKTNFFLLNNKKNTIVCFDNLISLYSLNINVKVLYFKIKRLNKQIFSKKSIVKHDSIKYECKKLIYEQIVMYDDNELIQNIYSNLITNIISFMNKENIPTKHQLYFFTSNKAYKERILLNNTKKNCNIVFNNTIHQLINNPNSIPNHRFRQRYHINNFLNTNTCEWIIEESENYANENGWTNSRHVNYPTTDIPTIKISSINSFIKFIERKIILKINKLYNFNLRYSVTRNDSFIVKYDSNYQKYLALHEDGSFMSYQILLNNSTEFEGGGTFFDDGLTFFPEQGDLIIHHSKFKHAGLDITKGNRYLLVGFLNYNFT